MYAIIEEGGGQRKVAEGTRILIDLVGGGLGAPGDPVTFDKVLIIGEPGGPAKIGQPYIDGAVVKAEIIEPVVKGEKLYIHKLRPKKHYRRKTGHRQRYTAVKVTSIKG